MLSELSQHGRQPRGGRQTVEGWAVEEGRSPACWGKNSWEWHRRKEKVRLSRVIRESG